MSTVGKVNYDFTADTADLDKKLRSVDEGVDKTSSKSSQFANKKPPLLRLLLRLLD